MQVYIMCLLGSYIQVNIAILYMFNYSTCALKRECGENASLPTPKHNIVHLVRAREQREVWMGFRVANLMDKD